ncbi:MAG: IS701 family transposase [Hamadaea sp.]|uniref:IS701 family transposase n=1 Tax=Hamadaea sp. TaxID=2024425 RepID=UPI0017BD6EEC|nr:IS701 family transposase [Hamadaea sp.]NUR73629.1 IS701 family transposase [Hamadaea sp.]NUT20344.1 IS701 family transposase [Hamadaea sp.]
MDDVEVCGLAEDLAEFTAEVFAWLTRSGWQERAGQYLRGLMLDGRRKSIQPMAGRMHAVNDQALNHFVTNSPWDVTAVRRQLARRLDPAIGPHAWAVDDTGWLKCGAASPCVTRQYTGTAGKVTNCQVGVSLNLVTDTASCPVDWRLFLPETWDPASRKAAGDVTERRSRARIPRQVTHREKWRLALDMIDEVIGWGLTPPLVVADAGYGDAAEFRQGLDDRGLTYVVGVAATHTAFTQDTQRSAPPYKGAGRRPPLIYREPAPSLLKHLLAAGRHTACTVTWRDGSRRRGAKPSKLRSRFVFLRVRPASNVHRRAVDFGDLPVRWLIAEWPPGEPEPTRYWLSNLPADTPHRTLVRLAKLRWRIEHDYREVKTGLGLDHYEGRTWMGWHHHTTLVSAAHGFLTLQRLDPKTPAPA